MASNRITLAERLVIFFARNPDEELTTKDVVEKFDVQVPRDINSRLRDSIASGRLAVKLAGPGNGRSRVYSAGETLLYEIGERQRLVAESVAPPMEACSPVDGG